MLARALRFVALLLISVTVADACPLCAEAARQLVTVGMQLDSASQVVLAVPTAGGTRFRVVAVVKGRHAVGDLVAESVTAADGAAPSGRGPFLLVGDPSAPRWSCLGTIPANEAPWLRQLAATFEVKGQHAPPGSAANMQAALVQALSDAGWRQRVAVVLPHVENTDPLTAQIAWGELARAPYVALEVVRSKIDPATVSGWLADPRIAPRYATYTLLLGFVGAPDDATRLERRIEAAWRAREAKNLSAMIAADLELRGPSRLDWIEAKYFADRTRTMAEIEAVLLALHVHGDADRTVPRTRVIQAYRDFISERPPMAGFVAPELADWNYWGAAPQYAALLKSKAIPDPASEFAVVNYLQRADAARAGSGR